MEILNVVNYTLAAAAADSQINNEPFFFLLRIWSLDTPLDRNDRRTEVQGWAKKWAPGLVNFVPAVDTTSASNCLKHTRNPGTTY